MQAGENDTRKIEQIRLSDFFKILKPTHVLGTTYTASLAFFESVVFPSIIKDNLKRCLLICDPLGFARAADEAVALRCASQSYAVASAPVKGSFHAKVWLIMNNEEAILLVGSGNLTQSGFMENLEIFDFLRVAGNDCSGGHARSAVDRFLAGLGRLWHTAGGTSHLAPETIAAMRRHLAGLNVPSVGGDAALPPRFLSSFDGALVDQLPETAPGGTLFVQSPYFGGVLSGLNLLRDRLHPARIVLRPGTPLGCLDVDLDLLAADEGVDVATTQLGKPSQFAHLKMYGYIPPRGPAWLVTGSPNCTTAAWHGPNVEAAVLRFLPPEDVSAYFPARRRDLASCPRYQAQWPSSGHSYLRFWASHDGHFLRLILDRTCGVLPPISDAQLRLQNGYRNTGVQQDELFRRESVQRLDAGLFGEAFSGNSGAHLLYVSGTDARGREVQGVAFVDNVVMLSSDPVHRSAWRAALALTEGESMPELADLSAVFALSNRLFEGIDAGEGDSSVARGGGKGDTLREREDRPAVWPPVAAFPSGAGAMPTGRNSPNTTLHWFQQVLLHMLRSPSREQNRGESGLVDAEFESDEQTVDGEDHELRVRPLSYAWRYWDRAFAGFDGLVARFWELCPDRGQADRLYAVGALQFLTTLAVHRWTIDQQAKGLAAEEKSTAKQVPLTSELARRFLDLLFCLRRQSDDCVPTCSSRYRAGTYPPLAYDLWLGLPAKADWLKSSIALTPGGRVQLHPDFGAVILTAFAYVKAVSGRLSLLQWLLFRLSMADSLSQVLEDREHLERLFTRFFVDAREPVRWAELHSQVGALLTLDWQSFPGFQDLVLLSACASAETQAQTCEDAASRFGASLVAFWQRQGTQFLRVPHTDTRCLNSKCASAYQADGAKSELSLCRPLICQSCGTALVPDVLYDAWQEDQNEELL